MGINRTYDKKQVVPSGPLFRSVDFREDAAYVSFDYADGLHTADGRPIREFEIAETEGVYYPAKAEVVGNQVKVYSDRVKHPCHVRYAAAVYPWANLVNSQSLPLLLSVPLKKAVLRIKKTVSGEPAFSLFLFYLYIP